MGPGASTGPSAQRRGRRARPGRRSRPAECAASSILQVGDIVLAMGNPLGLSATVTNGIVSALGRTVGETAGQGTPPATLPDTIQTSAAIKPGNSGGTGG